MRQPITGFHQDADGDWVAELGCGHNQHVRHDPPFVSRAWVLTPTSRAARIGTALPCPLCDRGELPEPLRHVRSSPEWDEHSLPGGLRRDHQLAEGTWGLLTVHQGALRYTSEGGPADGVELTAGSAAQAIPPQVRHAVEPRGHVRFHIDFFAVDRTANGAGMGDA